MNMDEKSIIVVNSDISEFIDTVKAVQEKLRKKMQENLVPTLNKLSGMLTTNKITQFYLNMLASFSVYTQSDKFQSFIFSLNKIINKLIKFTFSEESIKTFRRICALELLREIKWPFFLYLNDDIIQSLNRIDQNRDENTLKEMVSNIIFENASISFFRSINQQWNDCEWLEDSQKKLLNSAIRCYNESLYDATVAILMCIVDGIIDEIIKFIDQNKICYDEKEYIAYLSYFSQDYSNDFCSKKITKISEKKKICVIGSTIENANIFWLLCLEYIVDVVLTSKSNFPIEQPCRNKVCHGVQTDINYREIAIKSILAVDIIIALGNNLIHSKNKIN